MYQRLQLAFNVWVGRTKIARLQARLKFRLAHVGIGSPPVQELIEKMALTGWNIWMTSAFFTQLGFSLDDYKVLFSSAVLASPTLEINGNLVATFVLVDHFHQIEPAFRAFHQAVSNAAGDERVSRLKTMMSDLIGDVVSAMPST